MVSPPERPVRVVLRDAGLQQNRLTVLFRLLLVLPHFVWLVLWSVAATVAFWVGWLAALVLGRLPSPLHRFLAAYVRYGVHVFAYLLLATRRFPGFVGRPGYDVDIEFDPPARQRRLGVLVRQFLAFPASLLAIVIGAGVLFQYPTPVPVALPLWGGLVWFALLAWWAALVLGRTPGGIRDFTVYGIGYRAQHAAYALLLTSRYPHASPSLVLPPLTLPEHPVRLRLADELSRSRLTVLFRLPLALPHFVWLWLWGVAVWIVAPVVWIIALVLGRVPHALHRFLAAYIRYAAHVAAFVTIVGGPFPGFTGRQGSYPVDIEIDPPARQHRLVTLFRVFLAFPAFVISYPLGLAMFLVAVGGWVYALVRGRAPAGVRDLGAAILRYSAQTNAYVLLVTERYPYSSPALPPQPEPQPALLPRPEDGQPASPPLPEADPPHDDTP